MMQKKKMLRLNKTSNIYNKNRKTEQKIKTNFMELKLRDESLLHFFDLEKLVDIKNERFHRNKVYSSHQKLVQKCIKEDSFNHWNKIECY